MSNKKREIRKGRIHFPGFHFDNYVRPIGETNESGRNKNKAKNIKNSRRKNRGIK